MDKIVHYKVFKNDEEFTTFQKENEIGITSISPFSSGFDMNYDHKDADAKVELGIFVVFFYKNK